MAPEISVVVPAYKAESFITRSARSILGQTHTDWEMVIASDDTVDYCVKLREQGIEDKRIRCVFTGGKGTGPANARNTGLDAAVGNIVFMLDADDRLEPNTLAEMTPLVKEHGVAFSARKIVDQQTNMELPSFDRTLERGLVSLEDVLTSQIHTFAGIAFDKQRIGARWPSTRVLWEDTLFFVRCFDFVEKMFYVSEPLYVYYKCEGSICNRPESGSEYLKATETLLAWLSRGETLGIDRASGRTTFERFLRRWLDVEHSFLAAVAAGTYRDFRDYIEENKETFYRLPAVASIPAS